MPGSADAPILSTMSLAESLADTIGSTGIDAGGATVARLAAALGNGGLTAAELTAFYLARIGRLNPDLHAVITVSPAAAGEAAASDDRRASGGARGPLDGIPVLIKDNISADGLPATAGSPALRASRGYGRVPGGAAAGRGRGDPGQGQSVGMGELPFPAREQRLSTLGGQAVNPHDPGRSPSGSSSGSGAAIAAGLAPLAVGTETDGSIVSPASACGTVGIKPTLGLVSRSGVVPISAAQDTAGPMTRTVADAAVLLSAMAGHDPSDSATERAASEACDYTPFLDPAALAGAASACGGTAPRKRTGPPPRSSTPRSPGCARRARRSSSPVELAGLDKIDEAEDVALTLEFKHDINAYLAGLGGEHPADLAGLIAFNEAHAASVLAAFGQEQFEASQATSGDITDRDYLDARAAATGAARSAWTGRCWPGGSTPSCT